MKTRLLDATEFKATCIGPMRDVLKTVTNVIDIWPYVAAIPTAELFGNEVANGLVEHVYRTKGGLFDHVLAVTKTKNVFLVVIIDLINDEILGHYLLDLNHEFGLTTQQ